jgi:hypothetical protein
METGNSTAVGCQGGVGKVINPETPACLEGIGFMFNPERNATGTRGFGASRLNPALLREFAPIREQAMPGQPAGETHGTSLLAWIASTRARAGLPQERMLYRTHGAAGKNLLQISKGSQPYENGLIEVTRAKAICAQRGEPLVAEDCFISNGTQDRTQGVLREDFVSQLKSLANDQTADWNAITGANGPIRTWINQLSPNNSPARARGSDISLAQLDFVRGGTHARMVGPRYIYAYEDVPHFAAERGYVLEGEYMAKALFEELEGRPWRPLGQELSVSRSGDVLHITFDREDLVFDVTTLPPLPHFGFGVHDPSGRVSLKSAAIVSGKRRHDTVRLEFSGPAIGADVFWTYAFDGPGSAARRNGDLSGSAAWGNLRDSDQTPSRHFAGETLPNWCVILKEPVPPE